jgi:folate-binding protein YgfZ
MWRSPLHAELAAAGACFVRHGGCEFPERFGNDVLAEYRAVREAAGLLDLSYRRKLRTTGSDRVSFLQGMLSNDVAALAAGQGCHAAFLTTQGRVVADLRVYALDSDVLLDTEPQAAAGLIAGLEKHIVADDVAVADVSPEFVALSVQGPRAEQVVSAICNHAPPVAREFDHVEAPVDGYRVRLIRVREAGEPGYEILTPVGRGADLWRLMLERGRPLGLCPVGHAAFDILRVEAGIPRYGVDMDQSRIALEVGLDDAISTSKGCYLGQEVVERTSARGHVNHRLVGLRLTGGVVPPRGASVSADGVPEGSASAEVTTLPFSYGR